jgi:hypothetical protein
LLFSLNSVSALIKPFGVALDSYRNLYIADTNNNVIREVNAVTRIITTIAGNGYGAGSGSGACGGDGASATSAELNRPMGVALDAQGNLYIADYGNERIRMVNAATQIITTIAGNGGLGLPSLSLQVSEMHPQSTSRSHEHLMFGQKTQRAPSRCREFAIAGCSCVESALPFSHESHGLTVTGCCLSPAFQSCSWAPGKKSLHRPRILKSRGR